MKSKKVLTISALIASIPFGASMFLFLYNVNYLEYSSIFGDVMKEMSYSYAILGYKFDYETSQMYKEFVDRGNLSFTALCVMIVILVAFLIMLSISLKMKSIEAVQEQTEIIRHNMNGYDDNKQEYCSNCGAPRSPSSSFCSNCGASLVDRVSTPSLDTSKEKTAFLHC